MAASGAGHRRLRAALAAACCGALLLAACAGGDDRAAPEPPLSAASSLPADDRSAAAPAAGPAPERVLRAGGEAASGELAAGQSQRFLLPLERDRFVRLTVEPRGADLAVDLAGPEGEILLGADRRGVGQYGSELVIAVAERAGDHVAVVRNVSDRPGGYTVWIADHRPAGAADRGLAEELRRWTAEPIDDQETERLIEARERWRTLGEPVLEGDAELLLATGAFRRNDLAEAVEHARTAAGLYRRTGERGAAALARRYAGDFLIRLTRVDEAVDELRAALELAEPLDEPRLLSGIHASLGRCRKDQGELQDALDHYQRALPLHSPDDADGRAWTLHELGVLVSRYLGDEPRGRRLLETALEAWPEDTDRRITLHQLGQLAFERGDLGEARRRFDQALAVSESRPCDAAVTLARLALVDQHEGDAVGADRRLADAAAAVEPGSCPTREATVHRLGAAVAEQRGDGATARDRYRRGLDLYAAWGDRVAQAEMLGGIARAERGLGRPAAALEATGRALAIYEAVRPTLLREDLRTAFFADAAQDVFDLHVGLLIEQGRPGDAWVAAERARAQALRDLLAEAGAGMRAGADPELLARERTLQHRLNQLDGRLRSLVGRAGGDPAERRDLERRMDATVTALEDLRGDLRRRDPAAAAADPEAITLAALSGALDPGTLLLEYRLGGAESWLWVVGGGRLEAFPLPPRHEIETVAGEALARLGGLRWRPGRHPRAVCELAGMLLAPAASRLVAARGEGAALVVVADGVLEKVPFAALPDPGAAGGCGSAPHLVAAHRAIAHLPSVATLASLRRRNSGARPGGEGRRGWVAMVADPVYEAADERLGGERRAAAAGATRSGRAEAPPALRRLPHTGAEAAAILARLPAGTSFAATGAAATRQALAGGAVSGYRILHVAAHGVLDPERPLLSFLALSRFDARGRPLSGDLYAHEVYGLDLPAELVVLSACETAVGPDVRGEALSAGLPRAFLYAGAQRVLVSLWQVPDDSTRELMTLFYGGLIDRGLPPAESLREAQLELIRAGRRPQQWAGFVLQGDPRPLAPFAR